MTYRIPFAKEITHKEGNAPNILLSSHSKEKICIIDIRVLSRPPNTRICDKL